MCFIENIKEKKVKMYKDQELKRVYFFSLNYCKKYGNKSNGHSYKHTQRVLKNAIKIIKKYKLRKKVNVKTIIVSCLLHDISRSYGFNGKDHGQVSYNIVKGFLKNTLNFNKQELALIEPCMSNHCINNKKTHKSLEEKILYDADKNDGFGLRGYWRIFVYFYLERDQGLRTVWRKITVDMPKRKKELHFKE